MLGGVGLPLLRGNSNLAASVLDLRLAKLYTLGQRVFQQESGNGPGRRVSLRSLAAGGSAPSLHFLGQSAASVGICSASGSSS